ncbi:hypothetical protein [Bradyrhizobium sp. CCGUVB14]|uniref:hypothetical protein n=1 Tax=unclassified Bradyrhizobium TaxID=2631580 RepID=UPI0035BF5D99
MHSIIHSTLVRTSLPSIATADVDAGQSARSCVEPGRQDDDVERVSHAVGHLDAFGRDALDCVGLDANNSHVVPIECIEEVLLQRDSMGTESIFGWDQQVAQLRIP